MYIFKYFYIYIYTCVWCAPLPSAVAFNARTCGGGGSSYIGGLPSPAQNTSSPALVTVTNTSYGNESGSPQIEIISVAQA